MLSGKLIVVRYVMFVAHHDDALFEITEKVGPWRSGADGPGTAIRCPNARDENDAGHLVSAKVLMLGDSKGIKG